jgi:hypothetical protein
MTEAPMRPCVDSNVDCVDNLNIPNVTLSKRTLGNSGLQARSATRS